MKLKVETYINKADLFYDEDPPPYYKKGYLTIDYSIDFNFSCLAAAIAKHRKKYIRQIIEKFGEVENMEDIINTIMINVTDYLSDVAENPRIIKEMEEVGSRCYSDFVKIGFAQNYPCPTAIYGVAEELANLTKIERLRLISKRNYY